MKLPHQLDLIDRAEQTLADSLRQVAAGHGDEPDVAVICVELADQCEEHRGRLAPVIARYGEQDAGDEPERLHADGLATTRSGPLGLLRDLQDLYLLASLVDITWVLLAQAGQALRDRELLDVIAACDGQTSVQLAWLKSRMTQAAPQALIAADG